MGNPISKEAANQNLKLIALNVTNGAKELSTLGHVFVNEFKKLLQKSLTQAYKKNNSLEMKAASSKSEPRKFNPS